MGTLHVRLKKSWIRMEQSQRDTVRTLGFRRVNQVVEVKDEPTVRGMLRKVAFAVEILPGAPKPPIAWKGVTVEAGSGPPPKKKVAKKKAAPKKKATKKKTTKKAAKKKTTKKKTTKKKAKK